MMPWCYGLSQHECMVLSIPVQKDKDPIKSLVLPVILMSMALRWTPNSDMKRQTDAFAVLAE